jgi:hypothetical protein
MATSTPTPSRTAPNTAYEPSGWVTFAGLMLAIGGFFSAMWGLAAVLNDDVLKVGSQGVLLADFTTWGWVHILLGVIMCLTAGGLFTGQGWARWTAVFFAMVDAMVQVVALQATPLWSLAIITLDVIVIYQLTVNWRVAR